MGGLKNNWFLKLWLLFALIGPRGERGWRERRAFMMSRRLCVFPGSVSFQWWHSCAFGFPRGCPPINSILCLLLHFSYCVFSCQCCFFFFLCSLLFSEWSPRIFWRWFLRLDGVCLAVCNPFLPFYTWYVYFAFVFSLLRFGFVGLLLACLGEYLCDWVFCQWFRGFLLPPCVLCGLWFFFGRVKGFGMGIMVVWDFLSFRVCGAGLLCFLLLVLPPCRFSSS